MTQKSKTQKNWASNILEDFKMSRRTFVKASATAGAGLALGAGLTPKLSALAEAQTGAGKEAGQWIGSTCQGCTSWCSKQVYVVDGRAVKIRGNPNSKD